MYSNLSDEEIAKRIREFEKRGVADCVIIKQNSQKNQFRNPNGEEPSCCNNPHSCVEYKQEDENA